MPIKTLADNKILKRTLFNHLDYLAAQGAKGFIKFTVEDCRRQLGMDKDVNQRTFLRWYDQWCDKHFGDL